MSDTLHMRQFSEGKLIDGTTWVPDHDEFGTSLTCSVCNARRFYPSEVPPPCDHKRHSDTTPNGDEE